MWTISNFFRGRPKPLLASLTPALPALTRQLRSSTDEEVLTDALWSMSYISDGPNEYIQEVGPKRDYNILQYIRLQYIRYKILVELLDMG